MTGTSTVERRIRLRAEQADRLSRLAEARQVSEDRIVERALDILFSLSEPFDGQGEGRDWSSLSESALARVWDNDEDARYDNWQELYGTPAR